jgi:hypothetical protein
MNGIFASRTFDLAGRGMTGSAAGNGFRYIIYKDNYGKSRTSLWNSISPTHRFPIDRTAPGF